MLRRVLQYVGALAGQKFGRAFCPAWIGTVSRKFLPVCYGAHTGNAEEYFQGGPDSPGSLWRIRAWICKSMLLPHGREILPDIQTNVRLHASSEKACFVELTERSDSFRCCYGDTSCMGGGLFRTAPHYEERSSPHQETEAWPQHGTRTIRVPIRSKTELQEILPPDALRHGRSQAVVRRRRGEVISYACLLCELSAIVKETDGVRLSVPSLLKLIVLKTIFNVNRFFIFFCTKKIFFRPDFTLFFAKAITYNWSGTGRKRPIYYMIAHSARPCTHTYTFFPNRRGHA